MKILIVLPPNQPSGGNWTYSGRLQRGLAPYGIQITRKAFESVSEADYAAADLIHSYNAYATGRHIAPIAKRLGKPFVVTMTGTDVNEHLTNPDTRPSMVEAVEYASRIVFLTEDARQRLAAAYPGSESKSLVVNLGIDLPPRKGKTRADFGFGEEEFIFLLVAGIRPVKRPLDALEPLARVHELHPNVRFVVAGQNLDEKTYAEVQEAFARYSGFARYIGAVDYSEIPDLYQAVDVAMNTSSSEGLSHALLEAMSLGKPVLASHVPGNRDLIDDGVNGYLYRDGSELTEKALLLVKDADSRERVAAGGLATIREHFSLARELQTFKEMYESVMAPTVCTQH
ncbi:glycosyltransferase [Tumebacillus sp. DT12]|uniref:Glycosyltransferase n=1 Tax=Tumebacillus lacus TaxID=2995335 RepID=A0ABT3X0Y0_9BACL|nr:glycosyltransferase [Tumebacillus lacus]MCX7570553.1 glycosyltransferase [Tumebacillus lacus]